MQAVACTHPHIHITRTHAHARAHTQTYAHARTHTMEKMKSKEEKGILKQESTWGQSGRKDARSDTHWEGRN